MKQLHFNTSVLLIMLMILILAGGALFTYLAVRSDPVEDALSGDRVINTLFVIEQYQKPLASFVISYYPETRRATIFDIPGEIGLILKKLNRVDRIDALYDSTSMDEYAQEVGGLLGMEITFRVALGFEDLGDLVDLLEGVDLFIPDPVELYGDQNLVLLPSGLIRLDGDKVKDYISYEIPDDDREDTIIRRQRLIIALLKRLGEQNAYLKKPSIAQVYQPFLRMNLNPRIQSRLFDELANAEIDRVSIHRVNGNYRDVSGQLLLFPLYDGSLIKDIVKQSLSALVRSGEGTLTERVYTVEVLNGTASTGLASRTADLLRGFGYDVINIGNADSFDYEKTEIIDRSGYEEMAKIFADVIRCKELRFETEEDVRFDSQSLEYRADFTLIIGKDFNGRYVIN